MNLDVFKLSYQRENGLTFGFLFSLIFCVDFKEDKFDRRFAYILHVLKILDYRVLKLKYKDLDNEDLLREIFFLSRKSKICKLEDLGKITNLKSKETFVKNFDEYFKKIGLYRRRAFTLEETYKILNFWNPQFKGKSMIALLKIELAEKYTKGDYEELADVLHDNNIVSKEEQKRVDKFPPRVFNKLNVLLNKEDEGKEEEDNVYFYFYFLFLLSLIKK